MAETGENRRTDHTLEVVPEQLSKQLGRITMPRNVKSSSGEHLA
jgi:hypothetical protein